MKLFSLVLLLLLNPCAIRAYADDLIPEKSNAISLDKVDDEKIAFDKVDAAVRAAREILNHLQWDKNSIISVRSAERRLYEAQQTLEKVRSFAAKASPVAVDGWNQIRVETNKKMQQLVSECPDIFVRPPSLQEQIKQALPDLMLYTRLLEIFTQRYPNHPDTPMFQAILSRMPTCLATVALANVGCEGMPTRASIMAAKNVLDTFGRNEACIWKTELTQWVAQAESSAKLRQEISKLWGETLPPEIFDVKVVYFRSLGESKAPWQALYFPATDEDGVIQKVNSQKYIQGEQEYSKYWIHKAYRLSREAEPMIETVHTAAIFPLGFTSLTHDIRTAKNLEGFDVPQSAWWYKLLPETGQSDNLELLVVNRILDLTTNQEIPIIPRAWLIKRLLMVLKTAIPGNGYDEYSQITSAWNTSVPWIDDKHPMVANAAKNIQEGIQKLDGLRKICHVRQDRFALISAALSRKVTVGGSFQQDPLTKKLCLVPCASNIREGWILVSPISGARPTFKIVITDAAGVPTLKPEFNNEVKAGQFFFIPTDGRDTNKLFQKLKGQTNNVPFCWPTNGILVTPTDTHGVADVTRSSDKSPP